ncbi:MAG: SWIM zinc finger family protein [bacterium]|nr:SWIM zinc finger family protein [bacterium]
MLFTFKDFEQHFKESVLKRGMKLFENNKVEPFKHHSGGTYHYLVNGVGLLVRRNGDKILSCSCSCRSKSYCEHLSALLFYFHSDLFKESPRFKLRAAKKRKGVSTKKNQLVFDEGRKSWRNYLTEIKELFKSYTVKEKLEQADMDQLSVRLVTDLNSTKRHIDRFYLSLAIFSEFSTLLNQRLTGNESGLMRVNDRCRALLDSGFRDHPDEAKKEAWLEAILNALKNNRKLISGAYSFLVPRYLSISSDRDNVRKVFQALAHRKQKLGNRDKIDKLKVALLQAEIKLAALFNTTVALSIDKRGAEFTIAKADLLLCAQKFGKAFNLLEKDHDRIEKEYESQYPEYLEYVMLQARLLKRSDLELNYLLRIMVHGSFINALQLKRIDELVPENKRSKLYDILVQEIRGHRRTYSFEKLSMVLLQTNRVDELIQELKKFRNKFNLLHSLVLRRIPQSSMEILSLYALHVGDALMEGRYFKPQQGVIDKVKLFVDQLSKKEADFLINKILDLSGHQAQISKYIQSVMPGDLVSD